jgi:hypothetical protein
MSVGATTKLVELLARFDITEAFKTKGDLRRWSAKRTVGGMIATTACYDIAYNGMSWEAVCMCGISVLPLVASMFEQHGKLVN